MKVLGIAGSPRRGGNTDRLLVEVMRGATDKGADVKTIFLSQLAISACHHCDACFATGECIINDDMQMICKELAATDVIVLASPLHFMSVTAQVKAMVDRCQVLWARKYILKIPPLGDGCQHRGFFVSVGGRSVNNLFYAALVTVKAFFTSLDIEYTGDLLFSKMDDIDAISRQPDALRQAYLAGRKLVES